MTPQYAGCLVEVSQHPTRPHSQHINMAIQPPHKKPSQNCHLNKLLISQKSPFYAGCLVEVSQHPAQVNEKF